MSTPRRKQKGETQKKRDRESARKRERHALRRAVTRPACIVPGCHGEAPRGMGTRCESCEEEGLTSLDCIPPIPRRYLTNDAGEVIAAGHWAPHLDDTMRELVESARAQGAAGGDRDGP